MAEILLHLVDESGQSAPPQVRIAVEAAYRWALWEYRHFDRAELAEMAEAVATTMCARLSQIEFPRRYAFAALMGKLQEWYRAHPAKEITLDPDDFEHARDANRAVVSSTDLSVLFSEIKARLSERDRQILALLEQDLGAREIAATFGISHNAAMKAVQRARDRMAAILSETGNDGRGDGEAMPRRRAFSFKIW